MELHAFYAILRNCIESHEPVRGGLESIPTHQKPWLVDWNIFQLIWKYLLNGCECEGKVKSDCSEEEHEKNRRTEFKVISTGTDVKVINNSTDSFEKQE